MIDKIYLMKRNKFTEHFTDEQMLTLTIDCLLEKIWYFGCGLDYMNPISTEVSLSIIADAASHLYELFKQIDLPRGEYHIDRRIYPMENADFLGCLLMAKVYHPSNGAVRSFRESHTEAIREYRRREFGELFKEIRKRTAFGYRVDFFPKWVEPEHLLCSAEKYIYPGMTILLGFRKKGN